MSDRSVISVTKQYIMEGMHSVQDKLNVLQSVALDGSEQPASCSGCFTPGNLLGCREHP